MTWSHKRAKTGVFIKVFFFIIINCAFWLHWETQFFFKNKIVKRNPAVSHYQTLTFTVASLWITALQMWAASAAVRKFTFLCSWVCLTLVWLSFIHGLSLPWLLTRNCPAEGSSTTTGQENRENKSLMICFWELDAWRGAVSAFCFCGFWLLTASNYMITGTSIPLNHGGLLRKNINRSLKTSKLCTQAQHN